MITRSNLFCVYMGDSNIEKVSTIRFSFFVNVKTWHIDLISN